MAIKSRSDHLCKLTCVLMFSIYSCVIVWFITSETEIKSKYRIYSLASLVIKRLAQGTRKIQPMFRWLELLFAF